MKHLSIESETFTPSKIVCVGRNYLEHIRELGNETPAAMVIFNKPNSSISTRLRSSRDGETLHYEGEICFMVYQGALYGVGFGLDLTRRELQTGLKTKGLPWERAKAFDGAACFSDFVRIGDRSIEQMTLQLDINGELRQAGGYALMIHKPGRILDEIRSFQTLEDGDIIMTGTPAGVGKVFAGDEFTGRIRCGEEVLVSKQWLVEQA